MRYQQLGTIKKTKGLRLYEYSFNEGLLQDGITDVFVVKKPKKSNKANTPDPRQPSHGLVFRGPTGE